MKNRQIAEKIQGSEEIEPMEMNTAHLKLELLDVWGGDGNIRFQKMKKRTLDRKKKTTKTRSTMPGYSGETERAEIVISERNEPVNSFEEQDGIPILYLGRKIRGTLKQVGINLARMENPLFPSMAFCNDMMTMVSVTPDIVELAGKNWRENNGNYYLGSSGQQMARGRTFIPLYFDAFKKIAAEVDIKYPTCYDKQIRTMINLLPSMRSGNRRMMKINVLSCEVS